MNAAGVRCGAHCSECDRCFVSVKAFDKHRTGSFQQGTRRCRDPERQQVLVPRSTSGICKAQIDAEAVWLNNRDGGDRPTGLRSDVTIWALVDEGAEW